MTASRRILLFSLFASGWPIASSAPAANPSVVQFNRDIRPILSDKCFACHGPDAAQRQAELRLDQRESAVESVIVPGDAADSELIARITSDDPDLVMPPPTSHKSLTDEERQLLQLWIDDGAEYQPLWSLVPVPAEIPVPALADDGWVRNEIDAFVRDRLQREHLEPAVEATRELWLRRASFDLTGLPPSLEEIDAFVADTSATAHEKVVDRLLSSPAYGERMALDWLDAARYADTFGYQADRDMHVWPWRDWVIRAFNENLPYDQFALWQIAGDMLPDATRDQRLATAFNRLHRETNEGGSIEAEFRAEYVADRLRTMGTAFLGLTFECCRCHDHKYDPITQREYYQLSSFFNNIDEHGLYSHFTETAPTPALLLYEGDQAARHHDLLRQIASKTAELQAEREAARLRFDALTAPPAVVPPQSRTQIVFDDLKPSGDYRAVVGHSGLAIEFGGDDDFVVKDAPRFTRTTPFSLALWVRPTHQAPRMIVAHQSRAAEDSAFRGFSLVLENGVPVVSLIHFWPGNAIRVRGDAAVPLNEWTQITITYDGSSTAAGVSVFLNGRPLAQQIVRDRLTRDIIHRAEWGDSEVGHVPLALGARFRDVGFHGGAIDDLRVFDRELSPLEVLRLAGSDRDPTDEEAFAHYVATDDEPTRVLSDELHQLRVAENELVGQVRQIMVMEERSDRRPTFILTRGAYDAPGEPVSPGVPHAVPPFSDPADAPRDRLGFARWLVDEGNPLTARVAVNRYWRLFFGRGLVATAEDFGSQGEVPSHPELLDWLARRFMDSGWNIHELCRLIALSSTYRQSSVPRHPALYDSDPANRLLARGPRHRFSAEQLRDNALAVSGLLTPTIGGPSVFPYQPPGVWEESGTGKSYHPSTGPDLHRRSLYTFWRRTSPPPAMTTFDAPTREFCLARRERTATPLQALALLNDPQYIEAARILAQRLIAENSDDHEAQLTGAFRWLTSRRPSPAESRVLGELYAAQHEHFANHIDEARQYLALGDAPPDDTQTRATADQAALTAAIQALQSFDACVTKQ